MDVGAGSGHDAAWLASLGYEVLAVELCAAMRTEAGRLHLQDTLRWLDDRLPDIAGLIRAGLSAEAILLSAVWMHLRPADRPRAFRKLVFLLRPGGLLAISLRIGPEEPGRGMHPVSLAEIERLAGCNLRVGFDPRPHAGSDRAATLEVPRPQRQPGAHAEALPMLVDSTGLKLCSAGDWSVMVDLNGLLRVRLK
jgi:SAM-dependent methyltransferase